MPPEGPCRTPLLSRCEACPLPVMYSCQPAARLPLQHATACVPVSPACTAPFLLRNPCLHCLLAPGLLSTALNHPHSCPEQYTFPAGPLPAIS